MYGRLIIFMVSTLLGLMLMAFAFNYLWYKVFGTVGQVQNMPMLPLPGGDAQSAREFEREMELERERTEEREEERRARIEAEKEKRAQDAAKRIKELPSKRAEWQAHEAGKSDEQKAQDALRLAKDLLEADRREPAERRLRELIEKYPRTKAAGEAKTLLKK